MKYRKFGKLNWEASVLSFRTMRLPYLEGEASKIDKPLAIDMIRYAIDHGVNARVQRTCRLPLSKDPPMYVHTRAHSFSFTKNCLPLLGVRAFWSTQKGLRA